MKKLWNKDFILLLQGNAFSAIGDLLYSVAIGYWVYEKTGSSGLMGIMSSISMFMMMFLSPFTGSIIDRCNRKWIIVGMDAIRGVLMLIIGAMAFAGTLNVTGVLITAFLAAFCSVFFSPAVSTLMIDIIPHNDMVRGQSIHSGLTSIINLVGKAFSGVLVAFLGVPLIVVINGISYLISAFTELFIHVPRTIQQGTKVTLTGILKDFGNAIRSIIKDPFLRMLIPSLLIMNLLGAGPMSLMLPFCMEKGYDVDMYGYLMSIEMAASLLCVTLLGIVKLKPATRFRIIGISFTVSMAFYVIAYIASDYLTVCIFMFLGAFLNSAGNAIFSAALMLALPDQNRGAILGFIQSASVGGCALSAVLFGLLGEVFPLYLVFVAGCLLSLIPVVYTCFHRYTKEFILSH